MFPNQNVLHYSLTDLLQQLPAGDYIRKCDRQQFKKALELDMEMALGTKQRYECYSLASAEQNMEIFYPESKNNRVYQFLRERFK